MPASITLTVAHLPESVSFFLSALQPLNYVYRGRVDNSVGFGPPDAAPDFWITQSIPGVPPGPAHVAFPATSRANVHDFFHSALKAGGKVHGEPKLRDDCGYYSAAIIDVDGNSIEAVFRPDLIEASKQNSSSGKSVVSVARSAAGSKAPSVVSSASKAKTVAPSQVGSVAPSAAAKSTVSKAPSVAPSAAPSKAASVAPSAAPSKVASIAPSAAPSKAASIAPSAAPSKAPSAAPSQVAQSVVYSAAPGSSVSRVPSAAPTPSEVPARTTLSRAPTAPAAPQGSGASFFDMINDAKGTVSFAREIVNQARPLVSAPANGATSSPDSHAASDAIVGTLLGVAAGAALHYAFSNRNQPGESASAPATPPEHYATVRSETMPSLSGERYYYYHQQPAISQAGTMPYAIEQAPSDFSRASGSRGGQRLIEMVDHDVTLSEIAPSATRPRRRSSFSAVGSRITVTRSLASQAKSGTRMLEAPPTAYRAPTAMTMASDNKTRVSRSNSLTRSVSRPSDEGYGSSSEDRQSRISISRHSSAQKSSHTHKSRGSSDEGSVVTAIQTPEQIPLPASRAASHVDGSGDNYSTHSKANKTVIGRLTEKQLSKLEEGGRFAKGNTDVTRSVISKLKDVDRMDLSNKEVRPEDSVSQISSTRGSRRSHR